MFRTGKLEWHDDLARILAASDAAVAHSIRRAQVDIAQCPLRVDDLKLTPQGAVHENVNPALSGTRGVSTDILGIRAMPQRQHRYQHGRPAGALCVLVDRLQ